MNEFISIMQDVAKLATGGSDLARAEARRIDRERERRAAESRPGPGTASRGDHRRRQHGAAGRTAYGTSVGVQQNRRADGRCG